jgi:CCR4-NOT transcription complex subunit 1
MSFDNPSSSANRQTAFGSRSDKSSQGRPQQTSQFAWGQPSRRLPPLATSDLAFSSANQHNPASPFTSFQAGVRQPQSVPAGSNITSPRSRTVTPLSHLANTATATSSLQGEPGGGGGLSLGGRSGTYSPSLSGTNLGSPTIAGFERTSSLPASAGSGSGQSSLTKISVAQVLLLLDTISDKQGKAKWEIKAEQIKKVQFVHTTRLWVLC